MRKTIFIFLIIMSSFIFINNVNALTDTEEAFIYKYDSGFQKYYSIYIDRKSMKANIYGGVYNLNTPSRTINLTTYPYLIGYNSDYTYYCYSSKPFYIDTNNKFKTGGTFKCAQSNLSESSYTSYSTTYPSATKILSNFDIYNSDGSLYQKATFNMVVKPTIEFNNIQYSYNNDNKIISTSIDIILNNIDTSKHLAQYTTQSSIDYNLANGGIETWEDIVTEEDKTFITNINDTLYVRIIDAEKYWESADNGEELVIDIIDSATYTFTNIVDTLPMIQYSTSIPNLCKITHNDTDYISCVELSMNVKNMNVNKYKLYRMEYYTDTDTYTEWTRCYYTELKQNVNDNMTIFYKVTDIEDNLITSSSIKIESIREFLEQGLFIEFSDKYLKNSRLIEITMKIANDNNYTYYYSTNNGIEYNIVQDISDINLNIKKGIFYTDTNGKILVKVVDSNGQVVNIFEHTINYKQLQINNDSFFSYINSVFNFFITPITHIFSLITTFYTTLPTILQYLFSGIFILAIFYYISKFIL